MYLPQKKGFMMITNYSVQNSPNFNGSFMINYKNAVKGTREYMETKALNNHKIIFPNWNGDENCVFYITRDNKDYQVASAILRNSLVAKYFPNINTNSRFDPDFPEKLKKLVDSIDKSEIISGPKRIFNYVEKTRPHNRTKIYELEKAAKFDSEQKIINSLNNFFETERIQLENGIVKYIDKNGSDAFIEISPKTKGGNCLVKFKDKGVNEVTKFLEFDSNGELVKVYNYNETSDFINKYKQTINRYRQLKNLIQPKEKVGV